MATSTKLATTQYCLIISRRCSITTLLDNLRQRLSSMDCDFCHQESVLTLRVCSLHALLQHSIHRASRGHAQTTLLLDSETSTLHSGLGEMLLLQAELAREAGCFQVSNQGDLFDHVSSM